MFNNPFFKVEESQASSQVQTRPSVQDLLNKYGPYRISDVQSQPLSDQKWQKDDVKSLQSSQANVNILNIQFILKLKGDRFFNEYSIASQSNDGSNYSNTMPNQAFNNPLAMKIRQIDEYKNPNYPTVQERVTFGNNSTHNKAPEGTRSLSPIPKSSNQFRGQIFQTQTQNQCSQHSQAFPQNTSKLPDTELYEDMTSLKEKVLGMLQRYSSNLQQSSNQKEIKSRLKNDAGGIAKEYSQIIDKFNQSDISGFTEISGTTSKREQELQMMFNLVDEFLNKFQAVQQPPLNVSYQNLVQNKAQKSQNLFSKPPLYMNKVQPSFQTPLKENQILVNQYQQGSVERNSHRSYNSTQFQSTQEIKRKITNSSVQPIRNSEPIIQQTPLVKTPYQYKSPVKQRFIEQVTQNLDMTVLPQIPYQMDDTFYQRESINNDNVNQKLVRLTTILTNHLKTENLPFTRLILQEMIDDLKAMINSEDVQLTKTIIYRIEEGIKNISDSKEGSMKLYNYLNKAIKHSKIKATQMQAFRNTEPVKYNTVQKSQDFQPQRYTEAQTEFRPSQQKYQTLKRQFFDMALAKKHQLPHLHQGKDIMVSELYEEFLNQKTQILEMETFIERKLNLK